MEKTRVIIHKILDGKATYFLSLTVAEDALSVSEKIVELLDGQVVTGKTSAETAPICADSERSNDVKG